MMDISPLEPVRLVYREWLYRGATNLAARLPRWVDAVEKGLEEPDEQ
jgi:hypothetical protein